MSQSPMKSGRLKRKTKRYKRFAKTVSIPYEVGSIKTGINETKKRVTEVSIPYEVGSIKTLQGPGWVRFAGLNPL